MANVKVNDLANTIARNLNKWSKEITDGIAKDIDDISKESEKRLKSTSPKRTGRYARGWSTRKNKTKRTVYNKDHYQLTHLLEHGHLTKNGRRVRPRKHIEPVEEWAVEELENRVEKRINES